MTGRSANEAGVEEVNSLYSSGVATLGRELMTEIPGIWQWRVRLDYKRLEAPTLRTTVLDSAAVDIKSPEFTR